MARATASFEHTEFLIRRKFFTFLGATFHVFDPAGNLLLTSRQKAFRLKEDIRVFGDADLQDERMLIRARQIVDFSAAYDVVDAPSGVKIGALRRKGWRSIMRDSWEFLDEDDRPVAQLTEDSLFKAMLRRFLSNLIPQTFNAVCDGRVVATFKQRFNPIVFKLDVTVTEPTRLTPDLALAAAILLVAIEGRPQ
ncbi:MAG: hypothetical protein AB7O52_10090 [Planctomycetota bacterium]